MSNNLGYNDDIDIDVERIGRIEKLKHCILHCAILIYIHPYEFDALYASQITGCTHEMIWRHSLYLWSAGHGLTGKQKRK